jgi:hypothetical protein
MIRSYNMSKRLWKRQAFGMRRKHLYYAVIGMLAGGTSPAFCTLEPHWRLLHSMIPFRTPQSGIRHDCGWNNTTKTMIRRQRQPCRRQTRPDQHEATEKNQKQRTKIQRKCQVTLVPPSKMQRMEAFFHTKISNQTRKGSRFFSILASNNHYRGAQTGCFPHPSKVKASTGWADRSRSEPALESPRHCSREN